jgi:hypothetical protein
VVAVLNLGHRRLIRLRLDGLTDRELECSTGPAPGERNAWLEGATVQVHLHPASLRVFWETPEIEASARG